MGENPSNFYNDNVKYANPPSGGCNWDLDYYRTNYINAILLGQLKEGNYIKSGLVPSQGTGLNIEVTAGVAVIDGTEFEVNAFTKQAVLAPLGSVEFNLIYIDNSGVGQVIQSDPSVIGAALAIVDTDDTAILRFMDAVQLLQYDPQLDPVYQNHIVDGDFNFWYEGDSQSSSGYGSDTMWNNINAGSTKINSKQVFTEGQTDVPGNPRFFSRHVNTSVVGTSNRILKQHRFEDVRKLSGKTVTISFWAKADATKNITLEWQQYFGIGGSPSGTIDGIEIQKITLGTTWAKYAITVDIPSVLGKTVGADSHCTILSFWMDAGSDFDSRTDTLGQQSGTFDFAKVRLVEGEEDGDHIDEDFTEVLQKVGRFFQYLNSELLAYRRFGVGQCTSSTAASGPLFYQQKRAVPVVLVIGIMSVSNSVGTSINTTSTIAANIGSESCRLSMVVPSGLVSGNATLIVGAADGSTKISIDARL